MPSYAYYKKKFIPLEEAKMGVMTNFAHYGTGVFEGIRGCWNKEEKQLYLYRLKEHYERLMGKNPSHWKSPQNPVDRVRWRDAAVFCIRLGGLGSAKPIRMTARRAAASCCMRLSTM